MTNFGPDPIEHHLISTLILIVGSSCCKIKIRKASDILCTESDGNTLSIRDGIGGRRHCLVIQELKFQDVRSYIAKFVQLLFPLVILIKW